MRRSAQPTGGTPHAGGVTLALCLLALGCGTPEPTGPDPTPKPGDGLAALEARADARPLDFLVQRALADACLQAGRPGRALVRLRLAQVLAEEPPGQPVSADAAAGIARAIDAAGEAGSPEARGPRPQGAPASERQARRTRRLLASARRDYEEGRYDAALEGFQAAGEALGPAAEGRASIARLMAACHLRLALDAAASGEDLRATEHLLDAADVDPASRKPSLYTDAARLARRAGLRAGALGQDGAATIAFRRAFVLAPNDPETLFLLSRRPVQGAGMVPPTERTYYRRLLAKRHGGTAEALYFKTSERIGKATDPKVREALVEGFRRVFPEERALVAELRVTALAAREDETRLQAEQARREYEALLAKAKEARLSLEEGMAEPEAPEVPEPPGPESPEGDER